MTGLASYRGWQRGGNFGILHDISEESSATSSPAVPSFVSGQTVEWWVDLRPTHPNGILCQRLQGVLLAMSEGSGSSSSSSVPPFFLYNVATSEPMLTLDPENPEWCMEVGSVYKFRYIADNRHIRMGMSTYALQLQCVKPVTYHHNNVDASPYILAQSEPFRLLPSKIRLTSQQNPEIVDISPPEFFDDTKFQCPLSSQRPSFPIRVNGRCYERDALLTFLKKSSPPAHDQDVIICPRNLPISNFCVDKHMIAKLQRFTESSIADLLSRRQAEFDAEKESSNLYTQKLYLEAPKHVSERTYHFKSHSEVVVLRDSIAKVKEKYAAKLDYANRQLKRTLVAQQSRRLLNIAVFDYIRMVTRLMSDASQLMYILIRRAVSIVPALPFILQPLLGLFKFTEMDRSESIKSMIAKLINGILVTLMRDAISFWQNEIKMLEQEQAQAIRDVFPQVLSALSIIPSAISS